MSVNDVMNDGDDFICLMVKKTCMVCKGNINNMASSLPEGYNLLLNKITIVPGDRTLLAIG